MVLLVWSGNETIKWHFSLWSIHANFIFFWFWLNFILWYAPWTATMLYTFPKKNSKYTFNSDYVFLVVADFDSMLLGSISIRIHLPYHFENEKRKQSIWTMKIQTTSGQNNWMPNHVIWDKFRWNDWIEFCSIKSFIVSQLKSS